MGGKKKIEHSMSPVQWETAQSVLPLLYDIYGFRPRHRGGEPGRMMEQYLPHAGWYQGLDESIKMGLREPYEDAFSQLMEGMNFKGQLGGSTMSPAAGAAAGEFAARMGRGIGQQAWQMISPIQTMPVQMMPQLLGMTQSQPIVSQQKGFGERLGAGLMGGGMGYMGAMMIPGMQPFAPLMGGLMGLGGLLS